MGNLYKSLAELCEKKGISAYRMCKDVGIQPSIMTDLKMGRRSSVKAETAQKLADYFGITVGELLGNTETKKETPTEADVTFDDFTYALHNETKELTEEKKQQLLEMAKFFKQQQDKEKGK